jgi:small subunit ribosomal protein S6
VAFLTFAVETQRKDSLLVTETRITRDYELMAILLPDMAEEDNQAQIDRIRGFITDVQAEVTGTFTDSPWGRRRLAYTIRHEGVDYRDGFYIVVHFTATPGAISEIERELKLDTSVIRYLLVMDDPKAGEKVIEEPQAEEAAEESAPQVEDEASQTAAEETPVDAPAAGTEAATVEAADTTEPNAVEEVAEVIEGEEEPAPADAGETPEDKEA